MGDSTGTDRLSRIFEECVTQAAAELRTRARGIVSARMSPEIYAALKELFPVARPLGRGLALKLHVASLDVPCHPIAGSYADVITADPVPDGRPPWRFVAPDSVPDAAAVIYEVLRRDHLDADAAADAAVALNDR